MYNLDEVLAWANFTSSDEKLAFFKALLDTCGQEELGCIKQMIARKRKRTLKNEKLWKGPRTFTGRQHPQAPTTVNENTNEYAHPTNQDSTAEVPTPHVSGDSGEPSPAATQSHQTPTEGLPTPCISKSVRQPCQDVLTPLNSVRRPSDDVLTPLPAIPTSSKSLRTLSEKWWKNHKRNDFLTLDVEAVQKYLEGTSKKGKKLTKPVAAKISVVNAKLEVVYTDTIYHPAKSFEINQYTVRSSGIMYEDELEGGTPLEDVKTNLRQLVEDKVLVTFAGENDFRFMDLPSSDFPSFDLQSFYRKENDDNPYIIEPMSLRDVYFHYFEDDIQRGNHDASIDAKAHMKIFLYGYCKDFGKDDLDFKNWTNLNRLERGGTLWCRVKKCFRKRCYCGPCLLPCNVD